MEIFLKDLKLERVNFFDEKKINYIEGLLDDEFVLMNKIYEYYMNKDDEYIEEKLFTKEYLAAVYGNLGKYKEELELDKEIMLDISSEGQATDKRPHIVTFKLKYKDNNHHFAIPLRSNISKYRDRKTYHPLPELPKTINKTKEDSIRGIDYSEDEIKEVKKQIKVMKKDKNSKKNKTGINELYSKLDNMLYITDYIAIVFDKKCVL
jgi:hypothetical protein